MGLLQSEDGSAPGSLEKDGQCGRKDGIAGEHLERTARAQALMGLLQSEDGSFSG